MRLEQGAHGLAHKLSKACLLPGRSWHDKDGKLQDVCRGKCRICKKKASHYCDACSAFSAGLTDKRVKPFIFWCCQKDGACFAQHLQDAAASM
jgi:hypothetical protein